MTWTVEIPKRTRKQIEELPKGACEALFLLMQDIRDSGPVQGAWANYSKLGPRTHHCHLKKGQPTYVAVWEVLDRKIQLIEVQYVGTHGKAPY